MLVCNVSMRPLGRAIPATIAEVGEALDVTTIGFIVFATLVDDPASVGEFVDAYLGEIMVEAASASDLFTSGLEYVAAIAEATVGADSIQDGTTAAGYATFDSSSVANVTLSLGDLKATHSNTTGNSGARSASLKTTGQWYFEITINQTNGTQDCLGALISTGSYTNFVTDGTNCLAVYLPSGTIVSNNLGTGKSLGAIVAGNVIGVAIDLSARKAWMRKGAGNWNGDAAANPVTGTNGVTLPATVSFAPAVGFGGSFTAINDAMTMNAGQSAFANAAPSGFGGWLA
jgi:hypothetical protein